MQFQKYLIFFVFFVSCVPAKHSIYQESENHILPNGPAQVLIVGTGESGTRVFLEGLSGELNRRLKKKNVKTTYHHLGNDRLTIIKTFNELVSTNQFDGVLRFVQMEDPQSPIVITKGSGSVPLPSNDMMFYSYKLHSIRFKQKFQMQYFERADLNKNLLKADLDVNLDFLNSHDYAKLTKQIISSLKLGQPALTNH